ncbi:MAG: hypothetical protein K8W52_07835 [Deltaproteobacteria bacterium]|nr:hypothetical protein [Deltaproteobacteria bacterium]
MRNYLVSLLCAAALVGCKKADKAADGSGSASGSAGSGSAVAGSGSGSAGSGSAGSGSGSGSAGSGSAVAGSGATDPGGAGATAPSDKGGLTILDAGAEPRVQLAYKIPAGTKQAFLLSVDMGMDMGAMGGKMKIPSMNMDGDVAFAADGTDPTAMDYTLTTKSLKFVDTPGAAMPAAAINGKLAGVQNMVATGTLSPSGKVSNFKIDMKDAPPEVQQSLSGLRQSYDQMVTQFPADPVGKGARWQVVAEIDQNGVKAKQTAVFEVVSIEGSVVTLKNTVTINAPAQTINANGVSAELKRMSGTGSADLAIDLTKMIGPTTMTMHIDEELAAMGQSLTMAMDMKMKMDPK